MTAPPPPGTPPQFIPFTNSLVNENIYPVLIGGLISNVFFGIGLLQFYNWGVKAWKIYEIKRRVTDWFHLIALSLLLAADLADTINKGNYVAKDIKKGLVGGVAATNFLPRGAWATCLFEGVITLIVALIYIYRIYRVASFRDTWWFRVGLVLTTSLAFIQMIFAIVTGVKGADTPITTWITREKPWADIWLASASALDAILCLTFVWCLTRLRTDFDQTNSIIERAIAFTLEAGMLTSILQALDLILFETWPKKAYHQAVVMILPKIYINSILILLRNIYGNRLKNLQNDAAYVTSGGAGTAIGSATAAMRAKQAQLSTPGLMSEGSAGKPPLAHGVMVNKTHYRQAEEPVDLDLPSKAFPAVGGVGRFDGPPDRQMERYSDSSSPTATEFSR